LPTSSLARRSSTLPAPSPGGDALDATFARFLRLDVANGDAARETVRSYRGQVGAWVSWCSDNQVAPSTAGPDDVKTGLCRDIPGK